MHGHGGTRGADYNGRALGAGYPHRVASPTVLRTQCTALAHRLCIVLRTGFVARCALTLYRPTRLLCIVLRTGVLPAPMLAMRCPVLT
eukprot:3067686-Rhodomonas_salina.1